MNKYHSFFLFNVHPCNCAICPFLPYVLPLTYNPIAHSLIHGRLRAPTAMISPGAVCNLYCMFLWQRGREGEVIPRSCSAAIFPRGKCGTRGKEKRKLCFGPPATQNRITRPEDDGWLAAVCSTEQYPNSRFLPPGRHGHLSVIGKSFNTYPHGSQSFDRL